MSRILFVVPPLVGHINPTISVARELEKRGHRVAWAGHADVVAPLLAKGSELFSLGEAAQSEFFRPALERSRNLRGLESLQFLWETLLIPLARATRPRLQEVIDVYTPDVIAVDQQALAGALAARAANVPFATFSTTSAGVTNPLASLPKVQAWVDAQLSLLEREAGLAPQAPSRASTPLHPLQRHPTDLSRDLVIIFSVDALVGELEHFPAHFQFVGPSISERPDATPFPWERLAPNLRRVLISLGTVSLDRGGDFYKTCLEALGHRDLASAPWQIILVAPEGAVADPPPNFIVRARVPQLALLPHCHAVVCHAGHNTTCESLAHGLPLVVAPIRDDQPVVAEQVVRAGCGVRVKFGRLTPAALREAVARALEDPSLRAAAEKVRASIEKAGGASRAAQLLEELARRKSSSRESSASESSRKNS